MRSVVSTDTGRSGLDAQRAGGYGVPPTWDGRIDADGATWLIRDGEEGRGGRPTRCNMRGVCAVRSRYGHGPLYLDG